MPNRKEIHYSPEELELLEYMEGNPESVPNVDKEIANITKIFKDNREKRKQVNFRINQNDLEKLKSKALVEGIPYQTLLNSIVHKYLNGTLVAK